VVVQLVCSWRPSGFGVRCSMFDVLGGGLAYSLSGQLLLSPGVLAEQLGGKGFSVPGLSRFSRAFSLASALPPFHAPAEALRGQTRGRQQQRRIGKATELHNSTPCSSRGLPLDRNLARRLLRLAAISSAAAREPRFCQSTRPA
jgi:hypothetical protein